MPGAIDRPRAQTRRKEMITGRLVRHTANGQELRRGSSRLQTAGRVALQARAGGRPLQAARSRVSAIDIGDPRSSMSAWISAAQPSGNEGAVVRMSPIKQVPPRRRAAAAAPAWTDSRTMIRRSGKVLAEMVVSASAPETRIRGSPPSTPSIRGLRSFRMSRCADIRLIKRIEATHRSRDPDTSGCPDPSGWQRQGISLRLNLLGALDVINPYSAGVPSGPDARFRGGRVLESPFFRLPRDAKAVNRRGCMRTKDGCSLPGRHRSALLLLRHRRFRWS